ncbi:MAG: hypothetical protein WA667_17490 [Candidatus Nitrosopolaris sp.]
MRKAVNALQSTYRSIDIRAAVANQKDRGERKCIFAKVRLTMDNRSQVEQIHRKNKEDLQIQNNDNFQLLAECRNIQQLDSVIQEIQKGQITVQTISSTFITPEITDVWNLIVYKYNSFSTHEERSGYNHWFVFANYPGMISTYKVIENMRYTEEDLGIEIDLISKWFDIDGHQWQSNTSNFALLIPIYIKLVESVKEENQVIASITIHNSLLNYCILQKTTYSNRLPGLRLNKLVRGDLKFDQMVIINQILETKELSTNANMKIIINHDSIGKLYQLGYNDALKVLIQPTPISHYIHELVMSLALKLAQSTQKVKIVLDPFESYIYHILSERLPCTWLGLFENTSEWKDIIAKEKFQYTVDFILPDQDSVMIMECARQYTADRYNVGEIEIRKLLHFKEKLTHQDLKVRAVFICGEEYTNNTAFFDKILRKHSKEVNFLFSENILELQSNILKINNQEDILQYCKRINYSDNNYL